MPGVQRFSQDACASVMRRGSCHTISRQALPSVACITVLPLMA